MEQRLKEETAKRDSGLNIAGGQTKLSEWLDKWVNDILPAGQKQRSANTIDNHQLLVRKHLKPALGHLRLVELTTEDIEDLLQVKAKAGMAKGTLVKLRSTLNLVLSQAERRRYVTANVAQFAEIPPAPTSTRRSLTEDQAIALLDAAHGDPIEALIVTGLMLGLRPGELLGLTWEDVDFDAEVLHIRRALIDEYVIGDDGRRIRSFRLGGLKTEKSRRSLNMPQRVTQVLQQQQADQRRIRMAAKTWGDMDLVFATQNGKPIAKGNLRRSLRRLCDVAGIGRWTTYELRHSAASLLSAAGVPLEQIADVLGHSGTRMVQTVYRHPVTSTVSAAAAPMGEMFGS
ncbi:site-specific integrase [bacterium]|nr:site-specific integrase [bacterium]